jgi:hypothetical protein
MMVILSINNGISTFVRVGVRHHAGKGLMAGKEAGSGNER